MVPVLVPMAFTGELAYRLDYLLSNAGNFLPVFGHQFGINLESLAFHIPNGVIYGTCIIVLAAGVLSGSHVLHMLRQSKITSSISQKKYIAVYILIILIFLTYIVLFGLPNFHPEEDF